MGEKFLFSGKISKCWKKLNGGPFGIFIIHSVAKHQDKLKGGLFEENFSFEQKCLLVPKKTERGTLQSRPVLYVTREKTKTLPG